MTEEREHRIDSRSGWGESIVCEQMSDLLDDCQVAISEGRRFATMSSSWTGRSVDGIEDAMSMVWDSQASDLAKVDAWRQSLAPQLRGLIPDMKQQMVWSETRGSQIDVHRLIDGEAKFRRGRKKTPVDNRIVSLVIDVGMLGGFSAEMGFMRTAAALSIAELLEEQDIMVETWGISRSEYCYPNKGRMDSGKGYEGCWKVKAADSPLNLSAVCAGTSAWFFRTCVFQQRHKHRKPTSGMGMTIRGTDEDAQRMTKNEQAVCFAVNMTNNRDRMTENCLKETERIVTMLTGGGA